MERSQQDKATIADLTDTNLAVSTFTHLNYNELFYTIPKVCLRWEDLFGFAGAQRTSLFVFDPTTAQSLSTGVYNRYGIVLDSEPNTFYVEDALLGTELTTYLCQVFPNIQHLSLSILNSKGALQFLDSLLSCEWMKNLQTLNICLTQVENSNSSFNFLSETHPESVAFWKNALAKINMKDSKLRSLTLWDGTPFFFFDSGQINLDQLHQLEVLNFGIPLEVRQNLYAQLSHLPALRKFSMIYHLTNEDPNVFNLLSEYFSYGRLESIKFPFECHSRHAAYIRDLTHSSASTLKHLQINCKYLQVQRLFEQISPLQLSHLWLDQLSDFWFESPMLTDASKIPSLRKLSLTFARKVISDLNFLWEKVSPLLPLCPELQSIEFPDLLLPKKRAPGRIFEALLPECADIPDVIPSGELNLEHQLWIPFGIFAIPSSITGTVYKRMVNRLIGLYYQRADDERVTDESEEDESGSEDEDDDEEAHLEVDRYLGYLDDEEEVDDWDGDPDFVYNYPVLNESSSEVSQEMAPPPIVVPEFETVGVKDGICLIVYSNTHGKLQRTEMTVEDDTPSPLAGKSIANSLDSLLFSNSSLLDTLKYLHLDFVTDLTSTELFRRLGKLSKLSYLRICCPCNFFADLPAETTESTSSSSPSVTLSPLISLVTLHLDIVPDYFLSPFCLISCRNLPNCATILPNLIILKLDNLKAPKHEHFQINEVDLQWFRDLPRHFPKLYKIWLLRDCGFLPKLDIGIQHRATNGEAEFNRFRYHLSYQLHTRDTDEEVMLNQRTIVA